MKKQLFFSILYVIILLFFPITLLPSKGFILIIPLYNEKNPLRAKEYITCLEKNLAHAMIKKIHVIYDTSNKGAKNILFQLMCTKKLDVHFIDHRPTYHECFVFANTYYPDQSIILSNADIFFNDTLNVLENYKLDGKFIALTRHDVLENGDLDLFWLKHEGKIRQDMAEYSQDVWIFNTPLPLIDCDIPIGTWNCESMLAFQVNKTNLKLLNPCLTIQCCHLHLSGIRNYEQIQSTKPLLSIPWTTLN